MKDSLRTFPVAIITYPCGSLIVSVGATSMDRGAD